MNRFNITPVTQADIPLLLAMIRELAEFEHLAHEVIISADDLRAALLGERPVAGALIARVDAAVAGYALYYRTFSTFVGRPGVFLEDLYVRPEFRKGGLGRAMLEAVARRSVELGGGRLEWTALHWNENALRFYRGLGARTMEEWALLRLDSNGVRKLLNGEPPKAA